MSPRPGRIAVLLSGGVDSALALALLREAGHRLTAFYLKIWLEEELAFLGDCPWEEDLRYARAVCDQFAGPARGGAVPGRVPAGGGGVCIGRPARRAHAEPRRAVQPGHQVRCVRRPYRRRLRRRGQRALRAAGAGRGRVLPTAARGRPGQGPELLPGLPATRAAPAPALPPRRPVQASGARAGAGAGTGAERTQGQPGASASSAS